jgi:dUTP pyrophosphatase
MKITVATWGMVIFNHSDKPFNVSRGDCITQLIGEQICYPELEEVKELDDTERGKDEFDSTGRN